MNGSLTLDASSKTAARVKAIFDHAKDRNASENANETSLPDVDRNNDNNIDNNNNNHHNNNTLDGSVSANIKKAQSERIIRNQARDNKKGERGDTEETKGISRSYSDRAQGQGLGQGLGRDDSAGLDAFDMSEGVFQDDRYESLPPLPSSLFSFIRRIP